MASLTKALQVAHGVITALTNRRDVVNLRRGLNDTCCLTPLAQRARLQLHHPYLLPYCAIPLLCGSTSIIPCMVCLV